ncbi:hypothetical protein GCM10020221_24970 [Streptomyces thioluteus]|uniref:Pyruvate dehydrogenase E1 component n=1 Tax=Streptomyces thioluteus TaxID=66431 RepID=A0ABN3WXK4_STRTU
MSQLDQLPDQDPAETAEWLESLDSAARTGGPHRAAHLLRRMADRAGHLGADLPPLLETPYVNTVPTAEEPAYPGDEELDRRITAWNRWNAAAMVTRGNRRAGLGGHIATFASAAWLYETGFQHFFRGKEADGSGDQLYVQGHASPGVYARAFLEGRIDEARLDRFRQEAGGDGLPSYPHPRRLPWLWEFPTVSMGLGPLSAIYQARFNRYLEHRGIKDTSRSRVWAFLGDGEMDEPESTAALALAARERLDNLTFVVNCNLQRLDGPVRPNFKIVQELEAQFRAAGWHVVKSLWGSAWDPVLARDTDGALVRRLREVPDAQFQTYATRDAGYVRDHFFGADPRPARPRRRSRRRRAAGAVPHLARRPRAPQGARRLPGRRRAPGRADRRPGADRQGAHPGPRLRVPQRQPPDEEAHRQGVPRDAGPAGAADPRPRARRRPRAVRAPRRGLPRGPLPARAPRGPRRPGPRPQGRPQAPPAAVREALRGAPQGLRHPGDRHHHGVRPAGQGPAAGQGDRPALGPRRPRRGPHLRHGVPLPTAGLYSPAGQTYDPVDRDQLLYYKEAKDGQILNEGITEAGSLASFTAAATSYATHGEPMIPFYIFYSMFGWQRTADQFWALADQLGRGFVIGATAGRTTMTGEGLQHADGHSHLIASTNPAAIGYDPAFAYEVAVIVREGLRRMYGPEAEDVFYYLTVYNEPKVQPAMPPGVEEGILKGLYRYREAAAGLPSDAPRLQLLSSGTAVHWALDAQRLLADDWGVAADVWSAPSWTELRRDALACDAARLRGEDRVPYVTRALHGAPGPVVAVSDWMRAVPDQIAPWVEQDWTSLGTDGFGLSDTREAARRHFGVDPRSVTVAALAALARRGEVKPETVREATARYALDL